MTDRELLELAAKAAGYVTWDGKDVCSMCCPTPSGSIKWWQPLTDDGDALRLAVSLKITPHIDGNLTDAESVAGFSTEPHFEDPYAATRRAIVRAAAEMAKAKGGA